MFFKYLKVIPSFIFIIFLIKVTLSDVPKSKVVKCAVCHGVILEIQSAILKVDPKKKIEVGSFRINPEGHQVRETKKYAGSETHMMELLENVCKEFDDYVQARHKETDEIEVIKLIEDGKMNPRFGEYDLIQDPDLNKGVKYHCQSIVEDFEDEIMEFFVEQSEEIDEREEKMLTSDFCFQKTNICVGVKEEL